MVIDIGLKGALGGYGFLIKYAKRRFNTEAYRYSDMLIEGQTAPKHKIIHQKLILNKDKYEIGDSLFGKIEFKAVDMDQAGDTILQYGHGNFRALVKEKRRP